MFGDNDNQGSGSPGSIPAPSDLTHGTTAFPPVGTPSPLPQAEPSGPPIALPDPNPPVDNPTNHMTLDDLAASVGASPKPAEPEQAQSPAQSTQDPEPALASDPAVSGKDDLLSIKQQALQSLTPLVGKLEQTPLEKFKTTMMMIQASDDQSLIKTAYEAAGQITDEKEKAQALLDIVNEINYFTQQHEA